MKKLLSLVLLAISLSMGLHAQGVRPSVSVIGEAKMMIAPDQVSFTFEVVTEDKDLVTAKKENDERSARTLTMARDFKIPETDVQTTSLTIVAKYSGYASRVLTGYEVTKRMVVTLKKLDKIDEFVAKALEAGVNRITDVTIENSQLKKFQEQVRTDAVNNARRKAQAYASRLGQTVGKAYSIREEEADYPSNDNTRGFGSGNGMGSGEDGAVPPRASEQPITFALGQIEVAEKVYVIFDLGS